MELIKMADIYDIYGGQYLNATLVTSLKLEGKALTITSVEIQKVGREENAQEKIVLLFKEIEKQLVLNKTNARIIGESYSNDYTTWVGKRIFLQLTKRQFQGQLVDAVSVACESPPSPTRE